MHPSDYVPTCRECGGILTDKIEPELGLMLDDGYECGCPPMMSRWIRLWRGILGLVNKYLPKRRSK